MLSFPLFLFSISPIIIGFIAALILGAHSIRKLAARADAAWDDLEENRRALHDAAERYAHAAQQAGADDDALHTLHDALTAARAAHTPPRAAEADDALLRAVSAVDARTSCPDALHDVLLTDDAAAFNRQLYDNLAVTHNNTGVTFPTLLVAKRAGFAPKDTYDPEIATGAKADRERAVHTTLADTTRIMNAYMLWAVGMGGGTDTVSTGK